MTGSNRVEERFDSVSVLAVSHRRSDQRASCLQALSDWPPQPHRENGIAQRAGILGRGCGAHLGRLVDRDKIRAIAHLPARRGQVHGEQLLFAAVAVQLGQVQAAYRSRHNSLHDGHRIILEGVVHHNVWTSGAAQQPGDDRCQLFRAIAAGDDERDYPLKRRANAHA
jgi:hypothetical protein